MSFESIIRIRYKTLYIEASIEDLELAIQLLKDKIKQEKEVSDKEEKETKT